MALRILSLNAWGGRLHGALIPYLAETDPDVLCLQEVVRTQRSPSEWLTYVDGDLELPQRADLFGEVAAALPGHDAVFCPAARGELRDGDGKSVSSEWGLATFVRKSLPVIGQSQDFVHGDFSADGWGEHPRPRNAHGMRVFDTESGRAATIVHMHGLRDPAGKHDTPARQRQAEALVRMIRQIARDGEGLIVCGDFNVLPESGLFGELKALGLSDLVTGGGYADTRTSWYDKPQRFADYMLVNDKVEVSRFDVVAAPEVSDHRALLLEMV